MARPAERMRLKDKLVDNVSRAIKSLQEQFYYQIQNDDARRNSEENVLIIDNRNHACHKLLDSLDHALLYGIRNVTQGYWKVVKQLSHKGMIKDIELLPNVTTDLGRGRAWLHASLNEGLLESYIRLLTENEKLVKKHYTKDSVLVDNDKMNVLLTLTSGLDFVFFQLDYDLPYLDLSPSPPRTRSELQDDDDSSSVRSSPGLRSSFSSESRLESPLATTRVYSDSDTTSLGSCDVQSQGDSDVRSMSSTITHNDNIGESDTGNFTSKLSTQNDTQVNINEKYAKPPISEFGRARSVTPTDSTSISSFGSTGDIDRHKRLESIVVEKNVHENEDDMLEVIHVRSKKSSSKQKSKKKKLRSDSIEVTPAPKSLLPEKDNGCCESESGSYALEKYSTGRHDKENDNGNGEGLTKSIQNGAQSPKSIDPPHINLDNGESAGQPPPIQSLSTDGPFESLYEDKDLTNEENNQLENSVGNEQLSSVPVSAFSEIERRIAAMCNIDDNADVKERTSGESLGINHKSLSSENNDDANVDFRTSQTGADSASSKPEDFALQTTESGNVQTHHDDDHTEARHGQTSEGVVLNDQEQEEADDNFDFYSSSFHDETNTSDNNSERNSHKSKGSKSADKLADLHEASHLQDYMDFILNVPGDLESAAPKDTPDKSSPDLCLSLNNNMKLQVMLDIFQQEDENFLKMFACWENHTEGDPAVAYVLVSDQCLYILHFKKTGQKFVIQSTARLTDIIFISTGLFDQTLNIESRDKGRHKQRLWLTPGYQVLTQAIVECLTDAVKKAIDSFTSVRTRFSVGSDIPLQKIGLRKYITKQLNCESQDIEIHDYSLVYWEDSSSSSSGSLDAVTKEGVLLLHTQDPFKGFIWKPVFVVLKNGMLCISNKKTDPKPHSYLGLGGDQCVGCRRTAVAERENCVELVMAQAGSWFLSAATATEISEWSQALCLAVSQGIEEEGSLTNCAPCCTILACNKMFMCHEDLHTRFLRTLGYAQVEDVTGISIDEDERTYCIVEFESTEARVCSGQWVFYFASASDASRFISALDKCWKDIYQVELPVTVLDNVTLQHHCQGRIKHLRNALTCL